MLQAVRRAQLGVEQVGSIPAGITRPTRNNPVAGNIPVSRVAYGNIVANNTGAPDYQVYNTLEAFKQELRFRNRA